MYRPLALTLLTAATVCLGLTTREAAAQHPYSGAWEQPQPAAVGVFLTPTAAYPAGPMYYAPVGDAACQCERCRRARGENRPVRSLTWGLGGMRQFEQRKNGFLKRALFD